MFKLSWITTKKDTQETFIKNEIEAIKAAYAALNRNDIPAFVKFFSPDIERIEFEGFPMAGIYKGMAAVTEHLVKGRSSWAEGTCEPERFEVIGSRILVSVHVRVRLKHESEWREGRTADVFTFKDGKATQFQTFMDEKQALKWINGF